MEFLDAQNRLVAAPEPLWIRSPKRVRVRFGGESIADSTQARLFRPGGPPVYYFPRADVRQAAIAPGGRSEPGARGTMTRRDVRTGGAPPRAPRGNMPSPPKGSPSSPE